LHINYNFKMIVIVDYGMGNVASISNMIKKIGGDSIITRDKEIILNSSKLILPGVGAFARGIKNLEEFGLVDVLEKAVLEKKIPILGICLGMQLMTLHSEEGDVKGLGWLDANTIKFNDSNLKIPHIGWNEIRICKSTKLLKGDYYRFYFVHSYHVVCNDVNDILFYSSYGSDFVAGFEKNNILGVQFHPEKSHKYGMELFQNFLKHY